MTKLIKSAVLLLCCISSMQLRAGNPDRAGQAGATEILINPWARSTGWGSVNTGGISGLEAMFGNVAGLSRVKKTEIEFSHTIWLKGTETSINAIGLAQKVGESSALGISLMSFSFGDIPITTVDLPEGGIGFFTPQLFNISLAYSKAFSNSIYGGMNLKVISEAISNVHSQGVAIDAGIQYITGFNTDKDNLHIGITLKNVGTPMKFGGDGLSTRVTSTNSPSYEYTVEQRSQGFEIPSLVMIGVTYELKLAEDHKLSPAANFTSNSFTNDQYTAGLQYSFRNLVMLRGSYTFEKKNDADLEVNVYSGAAAGLTLQLPLGKDSGKSFGIDYSYRPTNPFDGTHCFGAKFTL